MRHYGGDEVDGDGLPWTDEPVPETPAGVLAHWAGLRVCVQADDYDGPRWISPQYQRLVRHFGRRGAHYPNDYELLPVRVDERGLLPASTRWPGPVRHRAFVGGGGAVINTGRRDVFRQQEIGPQSVLAFGYLGPRSREYPPAGVEGPAEVVYVWDGAR